MTTNIKIQHKHHWNSICDEVLPTIYQKSDDELFWIYSCNNDQERITFAWDGESVSTGDSIDSINNIPVYNMFRNGQYSYLGPGILALAMFITPRVVINTTQIKPSEIAQSIMEATIDYVLQEHGLQLFYNDEDPGLFDDTGAKIVSIAYTFMNSAVFVYYCSLNFKSDLTKFDGLTICGVENRKMANIFKTDTAITNEELAVYGTDLVKKIANKLYSNDVTIQDS